MGNYIDGIKSVGSHSHGNITNGGGIGVSGDYMIVTQSPMIAGNPALLIAALPKRSVFLSGAGGWSNITAGDSGFTQVEVGASNLVNYGGSLFPYSITATYHEYGLILPGNYGGGTLSCTPYFYTTDPDATSKLIVFQYRGLALASGDALDTAWGTAVNSFSTISSDISNTLKIGATVVITLSGSPAAGQFAQIRIARPAADTFPGDVVLLGTLITYTTNSYTDA